MTIVPSRCLQCGARVRHAACTNARCRAVYGAKARRSVKRPRDFETQVALTRRECDRLRRHG